MAGLSLGLEGMRMSLSGARSANRENGFPLPVPKYGEAARGPARDEGGFPARESGFCSGASTTKKHSPLVVVTVEILVAPFLNSGFRIGICEPVESLLLLSSPATASRASLLARPLGGTRDGPGHRCSATPDDKPHTALLNRLNHQPQTPSSSMPNAVLPFASTIPLARHRTPLPVHITARHHPAGRRKSVGLVHLMRALRRTLGRCRRRRSHEQSTRFPPYRVLFPKHLILTNRFIWYGAE
jgi:hypothetical protein